MTAGKSSARRRATGEAKFGWLIVKDAIVRSGRNNISIASAGVAFYVFLSIVPLLAATVLVYGLVADPQRISADIGRMAEMLPADAASLVGDQIRNVVETSGGKRGWGFWPRSRWRCSARETQPVPS